MSKAPAIRLFGQNSATPASRAACAQVAQSCEAAARYPGFTMLGDLDEAGAELADYMSEISEDAFCAGWMEDLEFELWFAVVGGPREYGRVTLSDDDVAKLVRLSKAAGGWIVFDGTNEETLVSFDDWRVRFEAWRAQRPR